MTITKDTLIHLNQTLYWDDDGYECSTLEEAKENSLDPNDYHMIRKQFCYFYEYEDLDEDEKENAADIAERDFGYKPEELMYVVSRKFKSILVVTTWDVLQEEVDKGIYTVVKENK